ncbi:RcnB family protein [Leisingera sp. S232]|uniref:RcnB family protein n=1 Tax=Leisingera sp. S232 TaxID=3415132 RepID=UPI0026B57026
MQKILMAAAVVSLALTPALSQAGPQKWAPGHKNSAAQHAPGQVKKRHRSKHRHSRDHSPSGEYIRGGDWTYVNDYQHWGLRPPRKGHRYVRQGDKIFEVVKDTLAIIGAVAVVNALTQ